MKRSERLPKTRKVRSTVDYEFLDTAFEALANPARLRLLDHLREPRYMEEIATHLSMTRQAARKHLERLSEAGLLERRSGSRERGAVTEYLVNPAALFLIHDELEKLGSQWRDDDPERISRTRVDARGTKQDRLAAPPETGPRSPFGTRAPDGPALTVVRGFDIGRSYPLRRDEAWSCTIGRDTQCPAAVPRDPYVSNRHAELRWDRRGFVLVDLRSTNGTTHNWSPIPTGATIGLQHGDLVGVGKTLLLFWDNAAPGHGPPLGGPGPGGMERPGDRRFGV